jgi:hypothetical protein
VEMLLIYWSQIVRGDGARLHEKPTADRLMAGANLVATLVCFRLHCSRFRHGKVNIPKHSSYKLVAQLSYVFPTRIRRCCECGILCDQTRPVLELQLCCSCCLSHRHQCI